MIEVRLLHAREVEDAVVRVPAELFTQAEREMQGRSGIGVDIKETIASTFRAKNPGAQQRGEKWVYSKRGGQESQQVGHYVRGDSLGTLQLGVFLRPAAQAQVEGATVGAGTDKLVAVPMPDAIGPSGMVKPEFRGGPLGIRLRGDAEIQIIETPGGLFVTKLPASGDRDERQWLFELEDDVHLEGGHLQFTEIPQQVQAQVTERLDKAAERALAKVDRGH